MFGALINMNAKLNDNLNTPYDDAFRTMVRKCDDLVIPMLNYMFDEHYSCNEKIIRAANEEFAQQDEGILTKRITDAQLLVMSDGKHYHVECESSTKTGSVLIRIYEYGSMIALDDSAFDEESCHLTVRFPHAGILYLRSNGKIPDVMTIEIFVPNGESCVYQVPVMRRSDFTIDQIFEEKMYMLIPFYLFGYESQLPEMNESEERLQVLLDEYEKITNRLDELVESDELSSRSRYVIIQMIKRVADKLATGHENVKKKVGDLMGGHVIDLDIFRAEDAAEARGEVRGEDRKLIKLICRKLRKGKSIPQIADELEEEETRIKVICDAAKTFAPDYDENNVIPAVEALEMTV